MSAPPGNPKSGAAGNTCPGCQSPISPNAATGLCARCAIEQVLVVGEMSPENEASLPRRFGNYNLLEEIGRGGFGVVYAADQLEPIRRRVAIKVVKAGMDTRQVVTRFEAERQALALMDHPNIARVFDAGTTPAGRPYFVMELVRGTTLIRYCDEQRLDIRQRLELLQKVCQAVQHAHHKGIIHRDLKPSNILVATTDGQPHPKVIDFGIAKATQGDLAEKTGYTHFHQFIGSPAYMSPEQAGLAGMDVDARTDVYSLGAVLYELLTGDAPFDARNLSPVALEEALRVIRETAPPRPSDRVSRLAAGEWAALAERRALEPARLRRVLAGDLDRVVMKALERDRTRRYPTATALAEDLEHFLRDEPVAAQTPGFWYRTRKAISRHRLAFSAGVLVTLALVLGTIISLSQAIRARDAEARSQMDERTATELASQLAQAHGRLEREKYRSDIQLADYRIREGDPGRARAVLSDTPARLRGWEWRYLWGQTRLDDHEVLTNLPRHETGLAFSPDGRRLLWNATAETVAFDMPSRRPSYRIRTRDVFALGHRTALLSCVENLAGKRVHRVIDLESSKHFAPAKAIRGPVVRQEFAPDDRILVTLSVAPEGGYEMAATDVASGEPIWRQKVAYTIGGNWTRRMDISPGGDAFAISLGGGLVHLFDLKTGAERFHLKATDDEMAMAVRFSPTGRQLLTTSGYAEGSIRIWDAQDGRALGVLEGHRTYVADLVFSPDGRELFSASGDYTIRVWDWAERRAVGVLHGHPDEVWCLALSPDGRNLASRGKDGAVLLWDLSRSRGRTPFRLLTNQAGNQPARILDDTRTFTFTDDGQGVLANEVLESPMHHSRFATWHIADLRSTPASFEGISVPSPDGRQVACLAPDPSNPGLNALLVRDRASEHILTNLSVTNPKPTPWLSYSTDGRLLVATTISPSHPESPTLLLCSTWETGDWQHRQFSHPFSPKLQFHTLLGLMSSNWFGLMGDAVLIVFDVTRPDQPPKRLELKARPRVIFSGCAVSPDGQNIVASTEDGYLTVWDWATLTVKWQERAFLQGAHSVAFSTDSKRLAAGSNANEAIKLWETQSWQELLTLRGEGSRFTGLKFSSDGHHLLAVNAKGAAHLWSAPSWEEIAAAHK